MITYLLHFDQSIGGEHPKGRARHYLGCTCDLDRRLQEHRRGHNSRIMKAIHAAGIGFRLARTWEGGRDLEKQLKSRHDAPGLCPLCREAQK